MKLGRHRTVNSPKLPPGVRKVGKRYYWRGTTEATRSIQRARTRAGETLFCGTSVRECQNWYAEHVTKALNE